MVQARYNPEQLRLLDEARFCQKTDAINRRVNAVYFRGLGKTQQEAAALTLVLDNARYQHCRRVVAHAAALGIDLLFLPGYSPNLSLIQRLWTFIKKDCLNGRYYPTHEEFQQAVLDSLAAVNTRHQETLKSTLTLNFQMFDNVQLLAA